MDNRAHKTTSQSVVLAFCSLISALGAALMATGGLIPIMTYCVPLAAGALLIPVLREYGDRWAWLVWFVTAMLSLILLPDKEAAFFYLFFGCYPILKKTLDQAKPKFLPKILKLLYFAFMLGLMYGMLYLLFPLELDVEELKEMGRITAAVLYVLLVLSMMIYDFTLKNLARLYESRIRTKLKFIK